ncbi:MAG TPA: hypothetical protein VFW94_08470 [Candidatus Acidoferrales bacterium]|nr:hypothetical protein [Candidatus Acidoferrales bacterium]
MKKAFTTVGLFAMLFATLCLAVPTRASGNETAKAMTYTGWISDSNCGAKGMSASHKACTTKCVKMGAKYVFVDSKTKAVDKISNQKAITDADLGHEVSVTGYKTKAGMLHVDSVKEASMSM